MTSEGNIDDGLYNNYDIAAKAQECFLGKPKEDKNLLCEITSLKSIPTKQTTKLDSVSTEQVQQFTEQSKAL